MTISYFISKFTIDPKKDIEPNFKLIKSFNVKVNTMEFCFNCRNQSNNRILKSIEWTSVQHCWLCNSINVIYRQDQMGGNDEDLIKCFTDNSNEITHK